MPQQSVLLNTVCQEVILKHTDIRYCGWNPKLKSRVNTKIENQGKVSYIELPHSSAACYYRRVDDKFARRKFSKA